MGAIIADRREQKLLEQDELILSDDEDDDTIEDEQIIIKNWYIPFLFIFYFCKNAFSLLFCQTFGGDINSYCESFRGVVIIEF